MTHPSPRLGALLGGLTSLPLIALLYLGEQFARLPFVPFDIFDWLARVLPGDLIALTISSMVRLIGALRLGPTSSTAKLLEQGMALALVIGGAVAVGALVALVMRRLPTLEGWKVGAGAGLLLFGIVALIEISHGLVGDPMLALLWLLVLLGGWGALLGGWLGAESRAAVAEAGSTRRSLLGQVAGGSLAVALGAWSVGRWLAGQRSASGASQALVSAATDEIAGELSPVAAPPAELDNRLAPAPGTREELTSNKRFYRIDINTRPIVIQESNWTLEVSGLFDNARPLTLADLMAYPAITTPVTMSCISNQVGGDLIGTSNWTGVRLAEVLKDLGIQDEATNLHVEAADGFFELITPEDMKDPRTMLVYGMNGETLPVEHGFPLRVYIPDRYGMKQPKWITRIEAVKEWEPGYWVVRGWSREARPQIVSVIDTIATGDAVEGKVPVGGIAWAGDRGIQKVEVQVGSGEWVEAALRTPTLSALTWVQWRYDWPATPGRHTLRVRATDGKGTPQTEFPQGVRPDGATGYHERSVAI